MKFLKLFSLSLLLVLVSCNDEPKTGPAKVTFDRDACERCRMLISDRFHVAQVRGGERQQAFKFDDVGGAVLWLEEQTWKDDEKTEVWVASHKTGEWLNAKNAWYVRENHTPMDYGFSAEAAQRETAVDYDTMVKRVIESEEKHNHHE